MDFSLKRYWKLKKEEGHTPEARYDEDVLSANWNPELPPLLQSNAQTEEDSNPQRPRNAGESDV